MSTDTPNTATQQAKDSAAREIEAFFNSVQDRAQQDRRLHHETGTCQFDTSGVDTWLVSVKDSAITTVMRDPTNAAKPDVTFACSPEVFLAIQHREGHLNAISALLQGLVVGTGDTYLGAQVLSGA